MRTPGIERRRQRETPVTGHGHGQWTHLVHSGQKSRPRVDDAAIEDALGVIAPMDASNVYPWTSNARGSAPADRVHPAGAMVKTWPPGIMSSTDGLGARPE